MDVRFKHPFTCMIAGPTKSGKTSFTFQLIDEAQEQITPPPERIMYWESTNPSSITIHKLLSTRDFPIIKSLMASVEPY